jgi:hypothetical protein
MFIKIPYLWFDIIFFFNYHNSSGFQIGTIFTGITLFHNISLISQDICILLRLLKTIQIMGKTIYWREKRFKYLSSLGESKTKCSVFDIPLTTAWLMMKTRENLCMFLGFVELEKIIELHFPYFLVFAFSKVCCTNTLGIWMEPHPIN